MASLEQLHGGPNPVPTTPLRWTDYPEKMPSFKVGARVECRRMDVGAGAYFPAKIAQVVQRHDLGSTTPTTFYSAIFENGDFIENIDVKAVRAIISEGTRIEARFDGGADWFPGEVDEYHVDDGTYFIDFEDGDEMPKAHRTLVRRMPWFFLPPQGSNSIDEVDGIMQKLNEENEEHARDLTWNRHPVSSEFFPDESHYVGMWDPKLHCPHGKGLMYYGEGHTFGGDWEGGKRHGSGTCRYSDGSVYDGGWVDDLWGGDGRLDSAAGDWYRGQWLRGQRHGSGNAVWEESGNRYRGGWEEDRPHGQGTKFWPDGSKYVGRWENGKRHGFGQFNWRDRIGLCVYRGHWRNGLFHGVGCLIEGNGSRFEGEFIRGVCEGYGVKRWPGGELFYYGCWKGGAQEGSGVKEFRSGALLDGVWVASQPHGDVVLRFPDGNVYEVEMDFGKYKSTGAVYANEALRQRAHRRAAADMKRAQLTDAFQEMGIALGSGITVTPTQNESHAATALEVQRNVRREAKERAEVAKAKLIADAKLREQRGGDSNPYAHKRERGLPPGRFKLGALRSAMRDPRRAAIAAANRRRRLRSGGSGGSPPLSERARSRSPLSSRGSGLGGDAEAGAAADAMPVVSARKPKPILTPRVLMKDESRLPSQIVDIYLA